MALFARAEASSSWQQNPPPPVLAAVSYTTARALQLRYISSTSEKQSNRAVFKSTPVDPKLLEYIQRIGVGIPEKQKRQSRRKRTRKYSRKHDTTVLDTQEELDFFRQRLQNVSKERRARKKPPPDGRSTSVSRLPPPPFASTPHVSGS